MELRATGWNCFPWIKDGMLYEKIKTPKRDVSKDYKGMDINGMTRKIFTCKKCNKRMELDSFSTSTTEQKWYVHQLFINKRCPKCYVDLMRGE
mgnify:CR=1 FL=1